MDFRVILGFASLSLSPRESLGGVRDVQSSVTGAFECAENSVASGGPDQAHVQSGFEGSAFQAFSLALSLFHVFIDVEGSSSGSGDSLVHVIQSLFLEQSSGEQQSSAVASRIVGESCSQSVSPEFLGVGLFQHNVSLNGGVDYLANDLSVGQSHSEAVFGTVILVLFLGNQRLAGEVIGFSLTSPAVLDLITLEIGLGLDLLDEDLSGFLTILTTRAL